jgi:hypothetical protein
MPPARESKFSPAGVGRYGLGRQVDFRKGCRFRGTHMPFLFIIHKNLLDGLLVPLVWSTSRPQVVDLLAGLACLMPHMLKAAHTKCC